MSCFEGSEYFKNNPWVTNNNKSSLTLFLLLFLKCTNVPKENEYGVGCGSYATRDRRKVAQD